LVPGLKTLILFAAACLGAKVLYLAIFRTSRIRERTEDLLWLSVFLLLYLI